MTVHKLHTWTFKEINLKLDFITFSHRHFKKI